MIALCEIEAAASRPLSERVPQFAADAAEFSRVFVLKSVRKKLTTAAPGSSFLAMNWQANLELFVTFALLFAAASLLIGITRKSSPRNYRAGVR